MAWKMLLLVALLCLVGCRGQTSSFEAAKVSRAHDEGVVALGWHVD